LTISLTAFAQQHARDFASWNGWLALRWSVIGVEPMSRVCGAGNGAEEYFLVVISGASWENVLPQYECILVSVILGMRPAIPDPQMRAKCTAPHGFDARQKKKGSCQIPI